MHSHSEFGFDIFCVGLPLNRAGCRRGAGASVECSDFLSQALKILKAPRRRHDTKTDTMDTMNSQARAS